MNAANGGNRPADDVDADRPADARDDDSAALAGFVGKWRARWPEWNIAEVFLPADQRELALAWATLQQELVDAAWSGADPRPGTAKLGWWQEELDGWKRGARRHPIATLLQARPAPWEALARALPALIDGRERPGDAAEAFAALAPFADAVVDIEAVLFDTPRDPSAVRRVSATLMQSRFLHDGDAHVPLDMLARAGSGDAAAVWAKELHGLWPMERGGHRARRLWSALARQRLLRPASSPVLPAWKVLWVAWRAAKG